jgi:hypothetical protein
MIDVQGADGLRHASSDLYALIKELNLPHPKLATAYAGEVVNAARTLAAPHPSPQARLAASGLMTRGGRIFLRSRWATDSHGRRARLGAIMSGAEFGSSRTVMFGPPSSGHFIRPALEATGPLRAANAVLQDELEAIDC